MTTETARGRFAIGRRKRGWPTIYIRHVGPRQQLRPGEIAVNLAVDFDARLLARAYTVNTKIEGTENPLVQVKEQK